MQIFVIPKKLVKEVVVICRNFLWARSIDNTKKAPIASSTMCRLKSCGGLKIRDLVVWNKAALLKILWAISEKKKRKIDCEFNGCIITLLSKVLF